MKYKNIYSPYTVKVDKSSKTITINYNETILKSPGLEVNLDIIKKRLVPLIKNSFKN